jgi:hypothetical protein
LIYDLENAIGSALFNIAVFLSGMIGHNPPDRTGRRANQQLLEELQTAHANSMTWPWPKNATAWPVKSTTGWVIT